MNAKFEPGHDSFALRLPPAAGGDASPEREDFCITYSDYGWDPDKDIRYHVIVPCFSAQEFLLPADLVCYGEDGLPLAVLLLDYPLEDEGLLRRIGDLYGNSLKRLTGQRPAIFFVTNFACKAVYSLLGEIREETRILNKPELEETVASYAIQEVVAFRLLLNDKSAANSFFSQDDVVREKINAAILDTLKRAGKIGFKEYLKHYIYSSKEDGKKLPKQLLMISALGTQEYHSLCQNDCVEMAKILNERSLELIRAYHQNRDLTGQLEEDPFQKLRLTWAFAYYGWNLEKDILQNEEVPCYLDENVKLMADYVFLNREGKPTLVFLYDTLNLESDRAFIVAEFYARSFKKQTGSWPLVVIQGEKGAHMKMGAVSGGFDPIGDIIPRPFLEAQARQVAVTEYTVWTHLLKHSDKVRSIRHAEQRQQIMMHLIQEAMQNSKEILANPRYVQEQYDTLCTQKELLEETFWEKVDGSDAYHQQRTQDLNLLRTVTADKRMAVRLSS